MTGVIKKTTHSTRIDRRVQIPLIQLFRVRLGLRFRVGGIRIAGAFVPKNSKVGTVGKAGDAGEVGVGSDP